MKATFSQRLNSAFNDQPLKKSVQYKRFEKTMEICQKITEQKKLVREYNELVKQQ